MQGSRQSGPQQARLVLSRAARLAALVRIDPQNHPRAAGLTAGEWESVRRLLEAIELAHPADGVMYVETLATKCRWRRSNLLRVARLGRRAGVLVSSAQYDERGRAASAWQICWDRLAMWAGEEEQKWRRGGGEKQCVGQCVQRIGLTAQQIGLTAQQIGPTHSLEEVINNKPSSSSSLPGANTGFRPTAGGGAAVAGAGRTEADGWRRLEEDLREFFLVDRAAEACAAARSQGCSAADVRAIAMHYAAHGGRTRATLAAECVAWGPAALCWRIRTARPGIAADRGWPQPTAEYRAELAAQSRRLAAEKAEQARLNDRAAAQRRRREAAESCYAGSMIAEYQRRLSAAED